MRRFELPTPWSVATDCLPCFQGFPPRVTHKGRKGYQVLLKSLGGLKVAILFIFLHFCSILQKYKRKQKCATLLPVSSQQQSRYKKENERGLLRGGVAVEPRRGSLILFHRILSLRRSIRLNRVHSTPWRSPRINGLRFRGSMPDRSG